MTKDTGMGLRILSRITVVALLVVGGLTVTAGALGATDHGCGTFSFGFPGTRLLNDGISPSAGPFTIVLPGGTYDITMLTNDNHPNEQYQNAQTQEQMFFELNSGYVSPPSNDIPNDRTTMTTTITNVQIAASTSITVRHLERGGINSLNVECIGFTPSQAAIAGPTTEEEEVAAPAVAAQVTAAPAKTASPATTAAPTTVAAATAVPTEVKAKVEVAPVAQLAVTGARSTAMIVLGFVLVGLGMSGVLIEQGVRRATSRT